MEDFKDQVKKGFNKCRLDIETIKDENSDINNNLINIKNNNLELKENITQIKEENLKIKQTNIELKETVQNLTQEITELKGEIKGIHIALEYIKSFTKEQIQPNTQQTNIQEIQTPQTQSTTKPEINPIFEDELSSENITFLEDNPYPIPKQIKQQRQQSQTNPNTKQDPYQALLAFKAKINKKELLKQKLMSMINDMGINLSELKFLFVDHYRYCSKATFYNYLKEIELEKLIIIKRENTKNFVYLNREMIRDEI